MYQPNQGRNLPFMHIQSSDAMTSHNRISVDGHLRENSTEGRPQSIDSVIGRHDPLPPVFDITTFGGCFNEHLQQNGVFRSK